MAPGQDLDNELKKTRSEYLTHLTLYFHNAAHLVFERLGNVPNPEHHQTVQQLMTTLNADIGKIFSDATIHMNDLQIVLPLDEMIRKCFTMVTESKTKLTNFVKRLRNFHDGVSNEVSLFEKLPQRWLASQGCTSRST